MKNIDLATVSQNDHSCASFIRKIWNDQKMTRKPDWAPTDITKRLSYKQDKNYTERLLDRDITENILNNKDFRSALNLGELFLCCVKTENLKCEPSNKDVFRLVFLKKVSVFLKTTFEWLSVEIKPGICKVLESFL